jgi:hypothetical protein
MMIAGTVISAAGQMQAADAAEKQGEAQQTALAYQANQNRIQAGQERAAAQRDMIAERRNERLVQSALIARAAASGAGASDPTIETLAGGIAAEGEYRALAALYQGETAAQALESSASARDFEASQARLAGRRAASSYRYGAFGTVLSSAGSLYDRYGGGGPSAQASEFSGIGYSARTAGAYG